jgi:chitinase
LTQHPDLHGVWDSDNPIGSVVLAHTNLTEIESAFDLFWRNDVPANKLNIGFGFYGRSFQLAQPSCFRPGCEFKGGAEPGPCSNNSGTLSYREIVDIIDHNNLEPYYDKKAGVKYIVWNEDQWVSYDDEETFKQKIDFANKLGLGGMLVWSVDQDTDDLKAMSALLAPKDLSHFQKKAQNTAFWQDISNADCYVTECGGSCQTGFIQTTTQPCGDATKITRHSKGEDSALCCPISAAPDPNKCQWRGTAPSCNGHCHDGEVSLQLNRWGDGKFCEDGNKAYCCETTSDRSNGCYWTNAGGKCSTEDELFTFSGTLLDTVVDALEVFPPTLIGLALEETLSGISIELESRYCCPPDDAKHWSNCAWHGEPGSCDDNRCNTGQQVQLTSAKYGLGESCFPRSERTRVFCCDATDGESPFLPVPLENLFPEPPNGDHINIDSHLKVDNTWGTGSAETDSDEPNDATFGFVVLASPEELQVSLDKRDGSDWEVFDCNDAISEEQQTIKIYCRNENTTNCDKIHLGHGAPGTIIEMPPGCGPSRYAVVKSLVHADTQEFPRHLDKRSYAHSPSIHDLTFDYNWRRVPRDLGDTLLRLDYSNEVGYWDSIVAKAASTKKKRSLEELNGNHKRWLEEEWRDDHHHGALTRDELHKRWFGEDIIAWLKGLSNPDTSPKYTHHLSKTFTAKLVEEDWSCNIKGVDVEAHLLIQALMEIDIQTSFGITIIAKLGDPIDLSGSYLRFKNAGEVSAIFTLDALAKAQFHRPFELFNMGNIPGATFSIPKLVTVGPNFRLLATIDASLEFAGHLESRARIAAWDVEMRYPAATDEFKPKNINPVSVDGTGDFQGISMPTFDYSYKVTGSLLAHLQPTFEFGIHFDEMWSIPSATVQLIADGSVELFAESTGSNEEICPFTYGVNVGARLYAHVDAPPAFGWSVPDFDLYPQVIRTPIKGGSCPDNRNLVVRDAQAWRAHRNTSVDLLGYSGSSNELSSLHLHKRVESHGPPFPLPKTGCYFCPGESGEDHTDCASVTGWSESQMQASTDNTYSILRRDTAADPLTLVPSSSDSPIKRGDDKRQSFCNNIAKINIKSPRFKSSSELKAAFPNVRSYGYAKPEDCNDYSFGLLPSPPQDISAYASEHILEFQLIQIFFNELNVKREKDFFNPDSVQAQKPGKGKVVLCHYLRPYFERLPSAQWPTIGGVNRMPLEHVTWQFPGTDNFEDELVLLDSGVNLSKMGVSHESFHHSCA